MCVEVVMCYITVVFLRHGVVVQHGSKTANVTLTACMNEAAGVAFLQSISLLFCLYSFHHFANGDIQLAHDDDISCIVVIRRSVVIVSNKHLP